MQKVIDFKDSSKRYIIIDFADFAILIHVTNMLSFKFVDLAC